MFLLLFAKGTVGQNLDSLAQCKNTDDTLRFIQIYILKQKDKLIGEPAEKTFDAFKKILPVKYAASEATSPWVDPQKKGNCYVDRISLYYIEYDELSIRHSKKKKVIFFDIFFEYTNIISYDFEHSIPYEDWENYPKYIEYFKHFIVKKIVISRMDWNDPDGNKLSMTIE